MKYINQVVLAVSVAFSVLAVPALAQAQAEAAPQNALSQGEIKKVDVEGGKLTIKHGELKNLGMPGMTMVFKVADPAMLQQVKQGDNVRFVAEKVGGALTVTSIEKAQ